MEGYEHKDKIESNSEQERIFRVVKMCDYRMRHVDRKKRSEHIAIVVEASVYNTSCMTFTNVYHIHINIHRSKLSNYVLQLPFSQDLHTSNTTMSDTQFRDIFARFLYPIPTQNSMVQTPTTSVLLLYLHSYTKLFLGASKKLLEPRVFAFVVLTSVSLFVSAMILIDCQDEGGGEEIGEEQEGEIRDDE